MNINTLCVAALCGSALFAASVVANPSNEPEVAPRGGPMVEWSAPPVYLPGQPYKVHVDVTAPEGGTVIANWLFTPSAFTVDGKQLGKREEGGTINLPAGFKVTGDIDLAPHLKSTTAFKLGYANDVTESKALDVGLLEPAPTGLDFMDATKMSATELAKYYVQLHTNRGDILLKMWPEVAPNHVRNFLDLSYPNAKSGKVFYDGIKFHRVMPGFMIQGGDPTGTGNGDGPRRLNAEFNAKKHLRGVLSMARSGDPNSASCQFFIMHAAAPGLDGQYSAFGEAVSGMDAVDKIATSPGKPIPGAGGTTPDEPQVIEHAVVLKLAGS
jgi:cyclophilin family peptidyl-prolyl cis-trans isomerase